VDVTRAAPRDATRRGAMGGQNDRSTVDNDDDAGGRRPDRARHRPSTVAAAAHDDTWSTS